MACGLDDERADSHADDGCRDESQGHRNEPVLAVPNRKQKREKRHCAEHDPGQKPHGVEWVAGGQQGERTAHAEGARCNRNGAICVLEAERADHDDGREAEQDDGGV